MNNYQKYSDLKKPSWAPPSWLFAPVWTALYAIIAFTFFSVFIKIQNGDFPSWLLWGLVLNLVFNGLFTPIQFGLKNNFLATIDILLVLVTLIYSIITIFPFWPYFSYLNVPYLFWVSFATILQLTITNLNRK